MEDDEVGNANKNKKFKIIFLGFLVHLLLLFAVFDVYFASPLDHGMTPIQSTNTPPAKRLILFVADGLRAEAIFGKNKEYRAPFLSDILKNNGSWGVVHTRVPTESRPGHVAMLAGIYEDPSAILKGWKSNPVHFDSVINQSTNSWCWGSPDIVNIFNRDNLPKIHLHTYGSEMEDFGKNNTGILDSWVFGKVEQFLEDYVKSCSYGCEQYYSQGNIFFLHLLGIDTAGHGFKPHSKEYINNIRLVDDSIKRASTHFERVFQDNSSVFVFTSDHGMTDWGSHGAGSYHETETPIIAWGAGIKANSQRQDINQIDIAPLLSSLIGINIPINSLGVLPTTYLDTDKSNLGKIVLANTKQLLEIFNTKRIRTENDALVYIPYEGINNETLTKIIDRLERLQNKRDFDELVSQCKIFMEFLIRGLGYYHNYYQYPVLLSVSVGFVIWIIFLAVSISRPNEQFKSSTNIRIKSDETIIFITLILITVLLCFKSKFAWTYYFYFSFPTVMYFAGYNDFKSLTAFRLLSKSSLWNLLFYAAGIELLVYGFFDRASLSLLMILVGLWVFMSNKLNQNTNKKEKAIWLGCCLVLAIFPSLPVMKTSFNVAVYCLGYIGWVIFFSKLYLSDLQVYKHLETMRVNYRCFFIQFVCLQLAALYILLLENEYISSDSVIKYLSWVLLIVPILVIPFTSKFIAIRLISTFFGFAPFYLLVSPNYEVLFSVFYVALLCTWLFIEAKTFRYGNSYKIIYYSKFEDYKGRTKISADVFRRAFLFMVFIFLGFFGTGNIASLNSFDPMWVRAFLTVFSPFKMMGLILLKFTVPFIFTCCIFRAINAVGKENVLAMFCIVLMFSDLMVLQFLYLITNVGSWLDIGTSLSHFVIMEGFVTILLLLYGIAYWLTTVSY